jgi:hypothetical protein
MMGSISKGMDERLCGNWQYSQAAVARCHTRAESASSIADYVPEAASLRKQRALERIMSSSRPTRAVRGVQLSRAMFLARTWRADASAAAIAGHT